MATPAERPRFVSKYFTRFREFKTIKNLRKTQLFAIPLALGNNKASPRLETFIFRGGREERLMEDLSDINDANLILLS